VRPPVVIGVALAGAAAFLLAGVRLDTGPLALARLAVLGAALAACAAIDLAERRIPNRIIGPAMVACMALLLPGPPRTRDLVGGAGVVLLMLVLSLMQPASFGMGDVKLSALVVLGLGGLAARALLVGLVLAAAFGGLLVIRHGRSGTHRSLPLAPFIGSGAALVILL
jgi:leader peptidase (prepilin peptidase)/N-methyltransferase